MAHDGEEALEWIAHRGTGEPNPAVNPLDIIMLNVRIATPPPGTKDIPPGIMSPDMKDVPPQVQAILTQQEQAIKQLTDQLRASMAALQDKSQDRAVDMAKIQHDCAVMPETGSFIG